MIALASPLRVFLYRVPTDMRKNFHGLIALTEPALNQDPLSGSLFVFVNRRRDRMKILNWGETGFCIWYQQLQRGTYQLPSEESLEGNPEICRQFPTRKRDVHSGRIRRRPDTRTPRS
jgi:transposase